MIKKYLVLFFLVIALLANGLHALARASPYAWSFTAKKTGAGSYEIHCAVELGAPWHTYSQFTPEGGPVATRFLFSKNPLYTTEGTVTEIGNMTTKHESVFGVDVKYFDDKVDFVQKVKMKGSAKTNFSGAVTFMVCNDSECLPPVIQKFTVALN